MAYLPKFPNCVDGNSYRRPLKTPHFETLSLQMDGIYSSVKLNHVERANLLELHSHLTQAESNFKNQLPAGSSPAAKLNIDIVTSEFVAFCLRNGLPVGQVGDDDI